LSRTRKEAVIFNARAALFDDIEELAERGIAVSHETVNDFGPMIATHLRKQCSSRSRLTRWHAFSRAL
jgi:hypothetical protein